MIYDSRHNTIQAMPLQKGLVNLTSGQYTDIRLVHCAIAGQIKLIWEDGTEDIIDCVAGDDFGIEGATVEIVAGTFHLAK